MQTTKGLKTVRRKHQSRLSTGTGASPDCLTLQLMNRVHFSTSLPARSQLASGVSACSEILLRRLFTGACFSQGDPWLATLIQPGLAGKHSPHLVQQAWGCILPQISSFTPRLSSCRAVLKNSSRESRRSAQPHCAQPHRAQGLLSFHSCSLTF